MARYTVHTADGPKRRTIYAKTYKEVQRRLHEALGDASNGLVYDDENMTVGEYLKPSAPTKATSTWWSAT